MSNNDSFIEEVTEEVRRDRLFGLMRRYGWIAVALIVLMVGAAAWNEWRNAQATERARAFGDALLGALERADPADRRAALTAIEPANPAQGALIAMYAADAVPEDAAPDAATLDAVTDTADLPRVYADLAELKAVLAAGADLAPADRIARLEPLGAPGAPYRLLALEQIAVAEVARGDTDAALTRLQDLLAEDQVSEGLRRRASQLIVALGGTLDAS